MPRLTGDENQASLSDTWTMKKTGPSQPQKKQRMVPQMEYLTVDEFNDVPKYVVLYLVV